MLSYSGMYGGFPYASLPYGGAIDEFVAPGTDFLAPHKHIASATLILADTRAATLYVSEAGTGETSTGNTGAGTIYYKDERAI
jgi:hypothetical protein